jgi:isopentenyl diphosphate isomerase/L-lactate dehydrogenase-like FMN-dependent dehydrogenase
VGSIEARWRNSPTRREALLGLAGVLTGASRLRAQPDPRPLRAHQRIPGINEMMTALDFEPVCFANISQVFYDYTAHGSGSEFTLRRNREAYDWVELIERPGATPKMVDTTSELLGFKLDFPILIAPTHRHHDLHPEGEAGMYKGATAARIPMIVGHAPSVPLEKVAASADGLRWSQMYPVQSLTVSRQRIDRYQGTGARAIVVTVDQQVQVYERDLHNRNLGGYPREPEARGRSEAAHGPAQYNISGGRLWYNWKYLDDIRPMIQGPLIIKGILTAEDARICVERGYDAIVVSNHGGRSMDYGASTLEVLPEVVDAVGGKVPVLFDGGIRRGSDIAKALALGARAVLLGRASRWALGAYGPPGVQRLLEILQAELREAMARAGCTTLKALDRSAVKVDFP